MKILFITQWFDPEPTFKGLAFAKALVAHGHEVEILTGFPNYPEGKPYPGYRVRLFQREVMEGVPVIRVALYPSHDRSAFRRAMNYLSFALSASTLGLLLVRGADVAYVYHPPATVGLAALVLKWFRGIPFVYDIQDLWPDTLSATGMINNRFMLWLVGRWCKMVYVQAARIVVLSPGFKKKLEERLVPSKAIEVIYNWCDEDNIHPVPKDLYLAQELGMAGKFNVVFAGNLGKAQGLDTVLGAAKQLHGCHTQIQFVFIGEGTEKERLKSEVVALNLQNVLFLQRRPYSEMASILSLADLLLVHLKNNALFEITIPSKIQAYLAMERPILAALKGDSADLVLRSGGGWVCPPESSDLLAEAIVHASTCEKATLESIGIKGRSFYLDTLCLRHSLNSFETVFQFAAR